MGKDARRHQAQQMRANKREEVLNKKQNLLGMTAPPILMILVLLHENFDLYKVENLLIGADDSAVVRTNSCGTTHIRVELVRF